MRDIEDWMFHFERNAGPRLSELFVREAQKMPTSLTVLMQKLRDADAAARCQKDAGKLSEK